MYFVILVPQSNKKTNLNILGGLYSMYRFLRPLLFTLPPEAAHAVSLAGLRFGYRFGLIPPVETRSSGAVRLMGLCFPNRLGLAAGLDKNGTSVDALGALGFGFIEIGTVTPLPQVGNARPRLFRLVEDQALINRMGFPNDGVHSVCRRLSVREYRGICGINIGKNAVTQLDNAIGDYVDCLKAIYAYCDYVAINISSPNTADLRRLQQGERLRSLLTELLESRQKLKIDTGRDVPLLIKLSADLDEIELVDAVRIATDVGIDGVIATNTTLCREGLQSDLAREEGGLSGVPLLERALRAVRTIRAAVGPGVPIIGVGGVASASDAAAMRAAGADLVQIYTGLVYRGPSLVREIVEAI